MRRVASLLLPALCLLLSSSWALAQTGASQRAGGAYNPCPQHAAPRPGCTSTPESTVQYVVCITSGIPTPGGPTTYYISGISLVDYAPYMGANVPQPPPGKSGLPWIDEFQEYVARTNPRAGKVSLNCNRARTETEAKATFAAVMPSGPPNRVQVVQTGWLYATNPPIAPPAPPAPLAAPPASASTTAPPAAAAAVAPAAAATAPPRAATPAQVAAASTPAATVAPQPRPTTPKPPPAAKPARQPLYVACWAEVPSKHTAYFSAAFESQNIKDPRTEFHQRVMMSYGAVGQFNCAGKPSAAEAEQQLEQWKETARAKDTIVDTGWKP